MVEDRRVLEESERVTAERDKALAVQGFLMETFGAVGPSANEGDEVEIPTREAAPEASTTESSPQPSEQESAPVSSSDATGQDTPSGTGAPSTDSDAPRPPITEADAQADLAGHPRPDNPTVDTGDVATDPLDVDNDKNGEGEGESGDVSATAPA